uniref:Uncharacterized protein n=1 Tax=Oryza glumipatula TaxID=40148 RepID=A0A0D9Z0F4_9ORYZ
MDRKWREYILEASSRFFFFLARIISNGVSMIYPTNTHIASQDLRGGHFLEDRLKLNLEWLGGGGFSSDKEPLELGKTAERGTLPPSERARPDKFQRKDIPYKKGSNPKLAAAAAAAASSSSPTPSAPSSLFAAPHPGRLSMAAVDIVEVTFEAKKHMGSRHGSLVEDKRKVLGFLVYPMPPEGAFDPSTDPKILKGIKGELESEGTQVRIGSAKTLRKVREKAIRRGADLIVHWITSLCI